MNTALLPTPRAGIFASLGWWVPGADLWSLFLLQCALWFTSALHQRHRSRPWGSLALQEEPPTARGAARAGRHLCAGRMLLPCATWQLGAGCVACPSRAALLFAPSCSVSSSLLWLWGHRRGCSILELMEANKLLSGPPPLTRLQCADAVQTAVGHP